MSQTPGNSSDREIVRRAESGDKAAFGQLYEIYLDQIYRYIIYQVADRFEAEDLTEKVFIKAWQSLSKPGKGKELKNFRAWIYRIAHNLVVDRHRKRKPLISLDQAATMQDTEFSPELVFQMREDQQSLSQAILKLDETLRAVILYRFVNQLSHAETAQIMGLKENHIRILQYRAIKKLRTLLPEGGLK